MRRMPKSAVRVAREALAAGPAALPEYGNRFSRHDYSEAQLFALLVLRQFLRTDHRGVVTLVAEWAELRRALHLSKLPPYPALAHALRRIIADADDGGLLRRSGPGGLTRPRVRHSRRLSRLQGFPRRRRRRGGRTGCWPEHPAPAARTATLPYRQHEGMLLGRTAGGPHQVFQIGVDEPLAVAVDLVVLGPSVRDREVGSRLGQDTDEGEDRHGRQGFGVIRDSLNEAVLLGLSRFVLLHGEQWHRGSDQPARVVRAKC
jgi:hypothetical protein